MAWTAPRTWTSGAVLTADQLNEQLRDNMLETMPAKATRTGGYFCVSDENEIVERHTNSAHVRTSESTTSATYTDLDTVGPQVTVTTGHRAFVFIACKLQSNTSGTFSAMSWAVSGATTLNDHTNMNTWGLMQDACGQAKAEWGMGSAFLTVNLTPGENIFTAKYRTASSTAIFRQRFIAVFPL